MDTEMKQKQTGNMGHMSSKNADKERFFHNLSAQFLVNEEIYDAS